MKRDRRNSKGEILAFDPEIVGADGMIQFEEPRAAAAAAAAAEGGKARKRRCATVARKRNSKGEELAFDVESVRRYRRGGVDDVQFEEARMMHVASVAGQTFLAPKSHPEQDRGDAIIVVLKPPTEAKTPGGGERTKQIPLPTPTVNTKKALEEVLSMFGAGEQLHFQLQQETPKPCPETPGSPLIPLTAVAAGDAEKFEIFDEGLDQQQREIASATMETDDGPRTAPRRLGRGGYMTTSQCRVSTLPTPSVSIIMPAAHPVDPVDPFGEAHKALVIEKLVAFEGLREGVFCNADGRFFRHKGRRAPTIPATGGVVEIDGAGKFDVDCAAPVTGDESQVHKCVRVGGAAGSSATAIKVSQAGSYSDWFISRVIHSRVPPDCRRLFIEFEQAHFYHDASILLSPYLGGGTLQRAIRVYQKVSWPIKESLVIYYSIELLRIASALHAAGIIHADIKPDNLMIRSDYVELNDWGDWTPSQSRGGWDRKGLVLIDYGHAIDRTLYPPGTLFCGKCHSETFTCADMRADLPWGFQIDAHGIAVTIHCLLFGSWLELVPCDSTVPAAPTTTPGKTKIRWKLKEELDKCWQRDLWQEVFGALLNAEEDLDLDALRHRLEAYLESDPVKSKEIRLLLAKQDVLLSTSEIRDDTTE